MSHRITTKTEIKDRDVAKKALDTAGYSYTEDSSNRLTITSGNLRGAWIDLSSGTIVGDRDPGYGNHKIKDMNALKAYYTEQKLLKEAVSQGIQITNRSMQKIGGREKLVLRAMTA